MREQDFRVSIIITSFNQRTYLVEAIESVLSQTLHPHEIIIADDCSSDGSQEVIRSYEGRYSGLVKSVLQDKNIGIPRNRNAALRVATGNYVGILDGDDFFLPQKLERQFQALRQHPDAKVVYSNFLRVDAERRPLGVRWNQPQAEGYILPDVARGNTGLLRTLIAEYRAVKQVGFMDERFPKYDGLWLSIQLAMICRFAYVHEILLEKREHSTSDSRSISQEEYLHDIRGIYDELVPILSAYVGVRERENIIATWQQLLGQT